MEEEAEQVVTQGAETAETVSDQATELVSETAGAVADQATELVTETATLATEQAVKYWEIIQPYIMPVIFALLILFFGRIVARIISKIVVRVMKRAKLDETLVHFLGNFTFMTMMVFVVLAALERVGVKTTSFLAVLGAAGLAIGLAFKDSLSNFSSGLMMLIFRPFKVGDFVEAGGTAGIVELINIFTTQMRTPDNKLIIVPNSKITADNITNFTAKDTRRMDLVFGVGYGDDLKLVQSTLEAILAADERILEDPAPTIGLLELGDSSVNFAVRPWVKTAAYWDVYFDLMRTVKDRFDQVGISIPFPQRDLHVLKDDASSVA